jgi:hypothetical protein
MRPFDKRYLGWMQGVELSYMAVSDSTALESAVLHSDGCVEKANVI